MHFLDLRRFLVRQHLCEDFVKTDLVADPFGDLGVVAGQHDAADAHFFEGRNRPLRFRANDVGERNGPGELIVDEDENDSLALTAQFPDSRVVDLESGGADIAGADGLDLTAFDHAFGAFSGNRLEFIDVPLFLGVFHDPFGDRVLGMGFDRGGVGDDFIRCEVVCEDKRIGDAEFAARQRARFIENDGIDVARLLKRRTIAVQQSVRRRDRRRSRHHQRHREAERMRTGDHHHRDGALHRER